MFVSTPHDALQEDTDPKSAPEHRVERTFVPPFELSGPKSEEWMLA